MDLRVVQYHADKSGLTTFNHESYHAMGYAGQFSQEIVSKGDYPSNDSGPANAFGELVAGEAPDISPEDAEKLVDEWLTEGSSGSQNQSSASTHEE